MQISLFKKTFIQVLIFTLLFTQNIQSFADARNEKRYVAFVGFKFQNLPEETQIELLMKMNEILQTNKNIILTKPDGAIKTFGLNAITNLIENQHPSIFQAFASEHKFDHVFSGKLVNQKSADNTIFLTGELTRYDLSGNQINRYMINKDYSQIDNEMALFNLQFVKSLKNKQNEKSGRGLFSTIVIGGAIVATLISLRVGLSLFKGDKENSDGINSDE